MIEPLISFVIVLILGSVLVPVLNNIFAKNYSFYLGIAFAVVIFIFFLVRLPDSNPCVLVNSVWTILTFPLRPLGLILVLLLIAWDEAYKKLGDDREGAKARESRKKVARMVIMAILILSIVSAPISSAWLARQFRQNDQILGSNFIDYVPSATGLLATTRIIERALPTLYNPFTFCPARNN